MDPRRTHQTPSVDTSSAAGGLPGTSRRRLVFAVALLIAAGAGVAIMLDARSSATRAAANAGSVEGAATVQRRNLVATDTESGTLSYADPQTVYDRLSGTITWLPRVGRVIKRGQRLIEVNSRPVILLYGSRPAYRELDASDKHGPDIRELNASLVALGYGASGIVADDAWQPATTDAVKAWQASLGERQTGRIAFGEVVFLPGEQLVNAIDGSVGAPTSFEGSRSPRTKLVDLMSTAATTTTPTVEATPTTTTPASTSATTTSTTSTGKITQAHATPTVTETVTVTVSASSSPGAGKADRGRSGSAGSKTGASSALSGRNEGSGGSGGAAILQTSSTRLVVSVDLPASVQREAVPGGRVSVEMPDGSIVSGRISSVSPIATTSGGGEGTPGGSSPGGPGEGGGLGSSAAVPVTITLKRQVKGAGLDQAPVSVKFAQATAKHVLSVPVTALLATSGSTYAVQETAAPHRLLPVSTGLFAAGYVQISGPGIRPGLKVTDSQG